MRIGLGPFSLERQSGRPYFINGFQLQPDAWVLARGRASILVPSDGPARGSLSVLARVTPCSAIVTDPLGRRYTLPLSRAWRRIVTLVAVFFGISLALALVLRRR